MKVIDFFKFYSWPILSGILVATSYIPFPAWALFFCLAPLWHFALQHPFNLKKLFIAGWLCQFLITLIGFHWVLFTIRVFGQMPWSVSFILFILFCSSAHLHIPISLISWSLLIRWKRLSQAYAQWILLPVTTALSFLVIPMVFKWHLGYSWLWNQLPAFHTAEIWGFEFLATITLFLQLCFLSLRQKNLFKILFPTGVVIFLALNALGIGLDRRLKTPNKTMRVLMVQHNIANLRDLPGSRRNIIKTVMDRLTSLTWQGLQKEKKGSVDFILWSEGVYPLALSDRRIRRSTKLLRDKIQKQFQTPLITGGTYQVQDGFTNSIFFFDKEGRFQKPRYDKNHLLMFGEFIPLEKTFPWIRKYFLGSSSPFIPGEGGGHVHKIGSLRIGSQICYEGLFSSFSRELTRKQANVLINITNDSWFGNSFEPYQHLYMSLARGIENRRPFIRLTNTGISAVMDARGNLMTPLSNLQEIWVQVVPVEYFQNPPMTLFSRWGYYINISFLILVIVILIFIDPIRKKWAHFFLSKNS